MLDTYKIAELGDIINNKLHDYKVTEDNTLIIRVSDEMFKKIDEDLFYSQRKDNEQFIPSTDEILISFEYLSIKIERIANGTT